MCGSSAVPKTRNQFIVNYRPAPAANRTAHQIEESLGYTSGFAHSKTDHEHGTSQGESEQKIPLMSGYETKLLKPHQVIVQMDGDRPTIAERLNWHDFPQLEQRGAYTPPRIPVLPPAVASPPSRYKTAPTAEPNFMPRQFPRVIFPPLEA
jgi:hypothetical protein